MAVMNKLGTADVARNSGVHAYYQIAACIMDAIENGSLAPGEELPSEGEMAEAFKVNRLTVRHAVQELASKGRVIRSRGRRTRIAMRKIPLDPFGTFAVQVAAHGFIAGTEVRGCAMEAPPKELRKLLCAQGRRKALHIARVRLLDATPVAVEDNYLGAEFAPPFIEDPSRAEHLYDALRQYCGLKAWDLNVDAELGTASSVDAARLDTREGHPLFSLRLTLSVQDKIFGYTHVRFLADRFHFHLGLQRYQVSD